MKKVEKEIKSETEMIAELQTHKNKILEDFARAYLAETNIPPSELELVTQQISSNPTMIETKMFFRRKQHE